MSIKYPNNYKMELGSSIEQELIIQNDGPIPWPADTAIIFSGFQNQLNVVEELAVGAVAPQNCTQIVIPIQMPFDFPENRDRFVFEYELRHSFSTVVIGTPLKLVVILQKPENDFAMNEDSSYVSATPSQNESRSLNNPWYEDSNLLDGSAPNRRNSWRNMSGKIEEEIPKYKNLENAKIEEDKEEEEEESEEVKYLRL